MTKINCILHWMLPLLFVGLLLIVITKQTVVNLHDSSLAIKVISQNWNRNIFVFIAGVVTALISSRVPMLNHWMNFLFTLQHELVHLICASFMGGKPLAMEVSLSKGGVACSSKSNSIVRLAPYFMPLFSFAFLILALFFSKDYRFTVVLLAGLFYSNFLVKTFDSLRCSQPDIEKSGGRIIALPIIFLFNIAVFIGIGHLVRGL